MSDPKYIYNFDIFDSADEAVEEYRKYFQCPHKEKPLGFLDWFCKKIVKPTVNATWPEQMEWEHAKEKHGILRTLQNRDVFMWKEDVTGKDFFNGWVKFELNNPNRGKSIADKHWIVDWYFEPINKEFDESING